MNDKRRFSRAIRINLIAGIVLLAAVAVTVVLVVTGALPAEVASPLQLLIFGLVPAGLLLLTAWLGRREQVAARGEAAARRRQR